jgi:hypothetical protein
MSLVFSVISKVIITNVVVSTTLDISKLNTLLKSNSAEKLIGLLRTLIYFK